MASRHKSRSHAMASALPLLLLLSLAVFLSGGCTQGSPSSDAVEVVPAAHPAKTERELLIELDKKFENPEAHFELARFYHSSGQWTKAEYHYDRSLGFRPGLVAAQAGLVKLYLDQNQGAKGEQFARGYISQASGHTRTTLALARAFENVGLDDYALRALRQALAEAPDSYEANKQMGLYYLGKGDTDRARQYLARSFELNPRQPDVAGALGRLGVVVQAPEPVGETEQDSAANR